MRKVKFLKGSENKEGYYVGIAPYVGGYGSTVFIVVEDLEGNVFSVESTLVKFTSPPVCMAPVKRIDLGLMQNALDRLKDFGDPYTVQDLIKLAEEKNIIIEETVPEYGK